MGIITSVPLLANNLFNAIVTRRYQSPAPGAGRYRSVGRLDRYAEC